MRFSTVAALITAFQCGAEAKVSIKKLPEILSHEHANAVGQAHTDAFEMLSEKYSDPLQRPESQDEMLKELSEIMASFCDHEPTKESCQKIARNYQVFLNSNGEYPEDFDENLLVLLDDIYTTLNNLQEDNVEEVLEKLNVLETKMNDVEADPVHKVIAMSGASVAIESTKLWTKVYTDSSHPLYHLHKATYYTPRASTNGQMQLDPMHGAHRRLDDVPVNCLPPVKPTNSPTKHTYDDHWVWIPAWGWVWNPNPGSSGDSSSSEDPAFFDRFNLIDIIQADIDGALYAFFDATSEDPVVAINPALLFATLISGAAIRSAAWAQNPPTGEPTKTPSAAPTISCAPTTTPSAAPTPGPTPSPTISHKPTANPTASPTITASATPTMDPTITVTSSSDSNSTDSTDSTDDDP
jgi:hypothetical protein